MSLKLYDDALFNKLNKWVAGTDVHLTSVNDTKTVFETLIDEKYDKSIQLPLITISRNRGYTIQQKYKQPTSFMGARMIATPSGAVSLNIIPIRIQYQIDIYAKYLEQADEYARNMIFNIINYPKLTVEIPYEEAGFTHDANIRIASDVEDGSNISERLFAGQFSRLILTIDIDDAFLFDVRVKNNILIGEFCTEAEGTSKEQSIVDDK